MRACVHLQHEILDLPVKMCRKTQLSMRPLSVCTCRERKINESNWVFEFCGNPIPVKQAEQSNKCTSKCSLSKCTFIKTMNVHLFGCLAAWLLKLKFHKNQYFNFFWISNFQMIAVERQACLFWRSLKLCLAILTHYGRCSRHCGGRSCSCRGGSGHSRSRRRRCGRCS